MVQPVAYSDGKASLFEGGIRVAGLVEWPARIKKGRVTGAIGCNSDYFFTALAAAGIDYTSDRPVDGDNLMPVLTGLSEVRHKPLYFQYAGAEVVMTQKFKALRIDEGSNRVAAMKQKNLPINQWVMFDMSRDVGETKDVAGEHPEILKKYVESHAKWNLSVRASHQGEDYGSEGAAYKGSNYRDKGLNPKKVKKSDDTEETKKKKNSKKGAKKK